MLLLDVTPLSLGIETLGGVMTTLIPRNTTIPTSKKETFSTAADNQTAVDVFVFQGERPMARDNRLIGNFRLDGLPPAPRGMPQVEVAFDIDANGILSVSAKDKATNREQKITIEASSGLNEKEISRLVEEAKKNEAADKSRRELIEARNELDSLVYQTEKISQEHGDKLPAAEKDGVTAAVAAAKTALDSDDLGKIKAAADQLKAASHKLAEVMYQSQPGAGPTPGAAPGGGGGEPKKGDDVIDAEYEDA
jgi:molecular chaperone DnaK